MKNIIKKQVNAITKLAFLAIFTSLCLSANLSHASMIVATALSPQSIETVQNYSKLNKVKNYAHQIGQYSAAVTSVLTPNVNQLYELENKELANLKETVPNNIALPSLQSSYSISVQFLEPLSFADSSAKLGFLFLNSTDKNQAISPLGLSSVFSMLAMATTGQSSSQIYQLFGTEKEANQLIQNDFPKFLQQLKNTPNEKGSEVFLFNKIAVNQKISNQVDPIYLQLMKQKFFANQTLFDASLSPAERVINQEVAKETQGKITQLLPQNSINASTQVIMTNTLHFKGQWLQGFDEKNTQNNSFYNENGSVFGSVKMMSQEVDLRQFNLNGYMVYDVPYQGGQFIFRMILLPEGKKISEMTQYLSQQKWSAFTDTMKNQHCLLSMPKFKMDAPAKSIAQEMQINGVKEVFSTHADFAPMLGGLGKMHHLDNVFHAVTLAVDEKGTEMSAATAATVKSKSLKPMCTVNRPFIFSVIDKKTSTPLVLGLMSQPQFN
jgi:serpin B